MGCFLACFGFSSKRKRRTSAHKFIYGDQSHGCYNKLLDKDIHNSSNPSFPDFIISDEDENRCVTFKKKVTFCSNVRTYEPIENEDCTSQVLENEKKKIDKEEEKGPPEENSLTSHVNTYPSSYRYQNMRDNWYEEDEEDMIYEESDEISDDDDDDIKECNEEDSDDDDIKECNEEDSDDDDIKECNEEDSDDDDIKDCNEEDSDDEKIVETNRGSQYICPVLLPVENISQWRSMKAKHKRSAKVTIESKENLKLEIIGQTDLIKLGSQGLVANQN